MAYLGGRADLDLVPTGAGWRSAQVPHAPGLAGPLQPDRLRLEDDPAGGSRRVMRAELRAWQATPGSAPPDGDVTDTGGYLANRSEVYGLHLLGSSPAENWTFAPGTTRWTRMSYYLDPAWTYSTDGTRWVVLTQFKGLKGGSPPSAVEIKKDRLQFVCDDNRFDLGGAPRGGWTTLDIGIRFSTSADGLIEVHRDDVLKVPPTPARTQDTYVKDGVTLPDPVYLKQGIYRTTWWTATHIAYFGAPTVGPTRESISRGVTP